MIVLSWNCRGLGQPRAVRVLRELIETHRPDVVILLETLVNKCRMEEIRAEVKFGGCFAVDDVGHSGGVCLLWKEVDDARVCAFGRTFITTEVKGVAGGSFILTGYYGYPHRDQRRASWELLKTIARPPNEAWCCMGDYNDLLSNSEKKGRREHPQSLMDGFRQAVVECGLVDLPLEGYPYTWVRSKGKSGCVEEKLDRAMVNRAWSMAFPGARLCNLLAPLSDHSPILMNTAPEGRIE
ncbi:hypothetical protein LINGRAHAP2_LOCUS20455 [Linum grandiflorum]